MTPVSLSKTCGASVENPQQPPFSGDSTLDRRHGCSLRQCSASGKRRVEHWREVPLPPELARDLEMVHYLREASPRRIKEPLWSFSRATAHRKVVAVMRMARIEGPQACPKGLRHGFGIAAVTAGVPLPTIAAVLGHADIATTAIYTTAVGVEARGFLARMWG